MVCEYSQEQPADRLFQVRDYLIVPSLIGDAGTKRNIVLMDLAMVPKFFFMKLHPWHIDHGYNIRLPFRLMHCASWSATIIFLISACACAENIRPDKNTSQQTALTFNQHIRPILSEHCFTCHGPDEANREAGLRLDQPESATALLDSGTHAIVPHNTTESEIIARISSDDADLVMPPPSAKLGRLSANDVEILKKWITDGATYEPHWAFVAPEKPKPSLTGSHQIDDIISRHLTQRGLQLQQKADRATLIRRASFDLTGLPPTPAEIESFQNDSSTSAYARLLDRLLESSRYGERMASDWLDISRYSDSYGFQRDRPRPTMWPWRDWVVNSFNQNMPWDRFVLWQLAGDLLPNASNEQILATAFNRLHQQENEGGSVPEEYRVRYVNDRVTTFGTAFLGLTLECCRCHDHKFDPLSQKDFYSLFAFFDDIEEAGLYSFFTDATPTPKLQLMDGGLQEQIDRVTQEIHQKQRRLENLKKEIQEKTYLWLASDTPSPDDYDLNNDTIRGEIAHYSFDSRLKNHYFPSLIDAEKSSEKNNSETQPSEQNKDTLTTDYLQKHSITSSPENTLVDGHIGQAIQLTGDHPVTTPVGNFSRSDPFSISCWIKIPSSFNRAVIFHRSKAWTDAGSRGYELIIDQDHLRWSLIHFWPGDAASIRMIEKVPTNKWVHVVVCSNGTGLADGLSISLDGHQVKTKVVQDNLTRSILGGGGDSITIGNRMRDHGFKNGLIDEFRIFERALTPLEIQECYEPGTLANTIQSKTNFDALSDYLADIDIDVLTHRKQLHNLYKDRNKLLEKSAEIMVMRESLQPKQAYVLTRGEYDKRAEPVEATTPNILPSFPSTFPRNRLGLAQWLLDPNHPLLARVTVNRFWQALFGEGLVRSSEDFGSQATQPEYPELLDLLAWKFSHPKDQGGFSWDVKALLRFIMTSDTYQQRSLADGNTMAHDPKNNWLARGPRHRLSAEMIRDAALSVSGLLDETRGGPPVRPYDIAESFKPKKISSGTSLYRRSIYTYWRRSGPAPVLEAFDLPNRVVCTAKRDTTNTPLHALILLNGTQFVEASRVLAEHLLHTHSNNSSAAIEYAFYLLTSRHPDKDEQEILVQMVEDQRSWYESHPEDAKKLLAVGQKLTNENLSEIDVAALSAVLAGLYAHDESVVKR